MVTPSHSPSSYQTCESHGITVQCCPAQGSHTVSSPFFIFFFFSTRVAIQRARTSLVLCGDFLGSMALLRTSHVCLMPPPRSPASSPSPPSPSSLPVTLPGPRHLMPGINALQARTELRVRAVDRGSSHGSMAPLSAPHMCLTPLSSLHLPPPPLLPPSLSSARPKTSGDFGIG